jgi:hypothetical protein
MVLGKLLIFKKEPGIIRVSRIFGVLLICFFCSLISGLAGFAEEDEKYDHVTSHVRLIEASVRLLEAQNLLYTNAELNITRDNIIKWLKNGNFFEDTDASAYNPISPRFLVWAHHFYEFTSGKGVLDKSGAYDWAMTQPERNWQSAINAYRAGSYESAFTYMGSVIHLLQDVGTPAHTRKDIHRVNINIDLASAFPFDYIKASDGYEQYCAEQYNTAIDVTGLSLIETNNIAFLFDSLANFTGQHHFSDDTILRGYTVPSAGDCEAVREENKLYLKDKNRGIKLARLGFSRRINPFGQGYSFGYFLDAEVYKDYWQDISPQVVEYGATLLKIFQDAVKDF